MSEFITRNYGGESFEVIFKTESWEDYKLMQKFCRLLIDHSGPASDVLGEWIPENSRPKSSKFYCSVCHRTAYDPQPNRKYGDSKKRCRYAYCPNCGAFMRKED